MVKLVKRAEWGARPSRGLTSGTLTDEPSLHWNGPNVLVSGKTTWSHSSCAYLVKGIQNYHMDANGWNDIGYNFIPCPHGYIFEGRGLNKINAANGTNSGNRLSHGIMNLAGPDNPFSDTEKLGVIDCVAYISKAVGSPNSCKGHRDHKSTTCPGDERYSWVHAGMPLNRTKEPAPIPELNEETDIMFFIQHTTGAAVAIIENAKPIGIKSAKTLENFVDKGYDVIPVDDGTWQEFHSKMG